MDSSKYSARCSTPRFRFKRRHARRALQHFAIVALLATARENEPIYLRRRYSNKNSCNRMEYFLLFLYGYLTS